MAGISNWLGSAGNRAAEDDGDDAAGADAAGADAAGDETAGEIEAGAADETEAKAVGDAEAEPRDEAKAAVEAAVEVAPTGEPVDGEAVPAAPQPASRTAASARAGKTLGIFIRVLRGDARKCCAISPSGRR